MASSGAQVPRLQTVQKVDADSEKDEGRSMSDQVRRMWSGEEPTTVSYSCANDDQHRFCDGMIRGLWYFWACLCRCHQKAKTDIQEGK